jgi:predicted ATP-dependent serine protease
MPSIQTQRPAHIVGGYTCAQPFCGAVIAPDKLRCPKCKHWHVPNPGTLPEDDDTVLLSDARVDVIKRLSIGFLDDVFGGGIVTTSTNLVAGPPGAGKTTLFLQLADIFAETYMSEREVLYIANEQSANEIKTTAQRIQVKHLNKIRIMKAMGGFRSDLGAVINTFKPCLIILDSLTKLTGDDPNLGLMVCERLKDFTIKYEAPCLIVNQINKDGDHAGIMKLQHAVDATFFLEKDDSDGSRMFYSTKNRNGEAPKGVEMIMTPSDATVPGKLILKPEPVLTKPSKKKEEESHNEEEETHIDGSGEEDPFG